MLADQQIWIAGWRLEQTSVQVEDSMQATLAEVEIPYVPCMPAYTGLRYLKEVIEGVCIIMWRFGN